MTDYFHLNLERDALLSLSSLGLAHLGDGVFEVMVRSWLILRGKAKARDLHRATVRYVAAPAQAAAVERLQKELYALRGRVAALEEGDFARKAEHFAGKGDVLLIEGDMA